MLFLSTAPDPLEDYNEAAVLVLGAVGSGNVTLNTIDYDGVPIVITFEIEGVADVHNVSLTGNVSVIVDAEDVGSISIASDGLWKFYPNLAVNFTGKLPIVYYTVQEGGAWMNETVRSQLEITIVFRKYYACTRTYITTCVIYTMCLLRSS